jgi:hypothetical protein
MGSSVEETGLLPMVDPFRNELAAHSRGSADARRSLGRALDGEANRTFQLDLTIPRAIEVLQW